MSNRSEALKIKERAPPRPGPKLICIDGKVVGDAVVIVSPRDPNWYRNYRGGNFNGEIKIRRQ
jgi:hypothetical protein